MIATENWEWSHLVGQDFVEELLDKRYMGDSVSCSYFLVPESVSVGVETLTTECHCVPSGIQRPILVGSFGGCRSFLERRQLMLADRCPSPRFAPMALKVHTIPVQPPLPLPPLQRHLTGLPPPDRGQTEDWPYPRQTSES